MATPTADPADVSSQKKRRLRIDQKFVLFPINNESLSRRVRLVKNGRVLRSFTASLGLPAQWWAHLDVSAWHGQTLTLSVEPDNSPPMVRAEIPGRGASETDNAELVAAIRTSAEIWSPETLYKEPLRPAFHFTSRRGWINDPNGLMYHAGQYHLFFQHNPYGVRWGNMHWGHAVSTDLVHWKELPIALYPRGDDDFPFSGSGVVDHENTSGWGKNGRPPMVIAFTSTGRGECIAYSQDDGATWKEFEGNPVIQAQRAGSEIALASADEAMGHGCLQRTAGRRPSSAQAPRDRFLYFCRPQVLAGTQLDRGILRMPGSIRSARRWRCESHEVGAELCGRLLLHRGVRWLALHTGEPAVAWLRQEEARMPRAPGDPFPLFYAAQTFSNHPEGHRVQIAWGRVDTADAPFTQLMSFPTTLSLRTTSEGVRLCREPVDAIRSLRTHTYDFPAGPLTHFSAAYGAQGGRVGYRGSDQSRHHFAGLDEHWR